MSSRGRRKPRRSSPPSGVRYRRCSDLVGHWSPRLQLYSCATGRVTEGTPLVLEVLDFFGRPRSIAQLARVLPGSAHDRTRVVRRLVRNGLIEPVNGPAVRRRPGPWLWGKWNPAAGFFHFSTKDLAFVEDAAPSKAGARRPDAIKHVGNARRVALPAPREAGELPNVLLSRRTWRRFSRRAVPVEELATLLGLTFGMQHVVALPRRARMHLRTSPSPGACQSLEAYVLARNVGGLPRGLYHYAADRHELERLSSTATRRRILAYLPTQHWYGDAAALVLITAVFPRVWWRYDYPRAYRAVLIEAGHFCQTFLLTATWLGLAPFCSMALADSRIERDLGIDGVTESVLYAAGVGVRPPGADWAPTPHPEVL